MATSKRLIMLHLFDKRFKDKPFTISSKMLMLVPVSTADNGVIQKANEYQSIDNAEINNKFFSSDFTIANLLAIGAYSTLTQNMSMSVSDMSIADSLQNFNNNKTVVNE